MSIQDQNSQCIFPEQIAHERPSEGYNAKVDKGAIGERQGAEALETYLSDHNYQPISLFPGKDAYGNGADFAFLCKHPETGKDMLFLGDVKDYNKVYASTFKHLDQQTGRNWSKDSLHEILAQNPNTDYEFPERAIST